VWIDIGYFSAPAMARLGRLSQDGAMVERALDQLLLHQRHLHDPATGLFWHVAYPEKMAHSACLWARGNSWFSIAAPEVLSEVRMAGLEHRMTDKVKQIADGVTRQLNKVIRLQDKSGLWHTVIDREDSYLEASATAGFALGLGRALRMRLGGLDRKAAQEAYERALAAVLQKINLSGEFTHVSQQTPPGDFQFYQSIKLGTAPFGTGVCMMALSEALAD
jgi:unsaturated rhamnogalacturonyl hydrolase